MDNLATVVLAPSAKKSKQNTEESDHLISDVIRGLLVQSAQPKTNPLQPVISIVAKHMLNKAAVAFIAKRLSTTFKKIGHYCSKPFELNDEFLAMMDQEKKIAIIHNATGRIVHTLEHTTSKQEYDFYYKARKNEAGDLIVTVARDHHARVWNVTDGRCIRDLVDEEPIHDAHCAELSNGSKIIITRSPHWVKVWSFGTGILLHTLQFADEEKAKRAQGFGSPQEVAQIALHIATAQILITYKGQYTAGEVRSLHTGRVICTLEKKADFCIVTFSPCGNYLITITENADKALRLWSSQTGRLLQSKHFRWQGKCKLTFNGTGTTLLIVHGTYDEDRDDENNVKLYSLRKGGELDEEYLFSLTHGRAQQATFNRAGSLLLVASKSAAEIRCVDNRKIIHTL